MLTHVCVILRPADRQEQLLLGVVKICRQGRHSNKLRLLVVYTVEKPRALPGLHTLTRPVAAIE